MTILKKIKLIEEEPAAGGGSETPSAKATEAAELTEEAVMEALKTVVDPEIPVDIVNLGLIYDVSISGRNVSIKLTLTTPGCHMARTIAYQAQEAVRALGAEDVKVEIVWDPPWNPDMMSDEAKQKLGIA